MSDIISTLKKEFIPYASEILLNNLPNVADGLLPVQRKTIWALYKNKVFNDKPYIKLLRASAMTMVYYTFGDLPLTGAMKNMANNGMNYFYLDPKGSFGDKRKKEGVGASPRYIECRLSKYSEDMVKGIDKNNVPMKRNFDDTEDEPIMLPSIIPNVLTNTSQSIAVGEASKIPAHNLSETCNAIIKYMDTEDINKAIKIIKCPDFSIGGRIIYDEGVFNKIYKEGRGSFTMIGKYVYDKDRNKVSIIEVPYGVYIEDIEDKLRTAYEKGLFNNIVDIHNASGRQGIQLDIYLKKNTDVKMFESMLRKYTPYESKFACNFTLIDLDGKTPMLMPLQNIFDRWITHRVTCIKKELTYDVERIIVELNKLYGLKKILADLDKYHTLIRKSDTEQDALLAVGKEFGLNKQQIIYISTIRSVTLNKKWIQEKIDNISALENKKTEIMKILSDENKIKDIIISQLKEISKKHHQPRKTEILYDVEAITIVEEQIEDYNVVIYRTRDNYLKKVPCISLRGSGEHRLKDGDIIVQEINTTNTSELLFFTNQGNIYRQKIHELEDMKLSNLGSYLPLQLSLLSDEIIIDMIIPNYGSKNSILIAYDNGYIARINIDSYKSNYKKIKWNISSNVVSIKYITEDINVLLITSEGKCLILNTDSISVVNNKNSVGLKSINVKTGDKVLFVDYNIKDNYKVKLCTNKGKWLDFIIDDINYYIGTRGSVGNFLYNTRKNNDKIQIIN